MNFDFHRIIAFGRMPACVLALKASDLDLWECPTASRSACLKMVDANELRQRTICPQRRNLLKNANYWDRNLHTMARRYRIRKEPPHEKVKSPWAENLFSCLHQTRSDWRVGRAPSSLFHFTWRWSFQSTAADQQFNHAQQSHLINFN